MAAAASSHSQEGSNRLLSWDLDEVDYSSSASSLFAPSADTSLAKLSRAEVEKGLKHAVACKLGRECTVPNCARFKFLLDHSSRCDSEVPARCEVCLHHSRVVAEHAKRCRDEQCLVPRCKDLRGRQLSSKNAILAIMRLLQRKPGAEATSSPRKFRLFKSKSTDSSANAAMSTEEAEEARDAFAEEDDDFDLDEYVRHLGEDPTSPPGSSRSLVD
jgi:hypothetical protein